MANKKINTLQLKKFMEKQIEELDEIKKLRAELKIEKNDKNFVNSLDIWNVCIKLVKKL